MYKRIISVFLMLMAMNLCAEEISEADTAVIDPSDLTQVFTMGSIWLNSQQNVRATASWAGSWSEDQQFMGFVEGIWGDKDDENAWGTDLLNIRAQYFHVIETHIEALPSTGFSLDYMEEENGDNLAAVGVLARLPPSLTGGVQVFPNAAYMKGEVASTLIFYNDRLNEKETVVTMGMKFYL